MRTLFIGFVFFSIIIFHSCAKHAGDIIAPPPAATISYSNPLPGSVFYFGDTVTVEALAVAKKTVHGYDFSINKKNDTTPLFFKHVHDHNDTLVIKQKWGNNFLLSTDLEARILLYLDHDGNTFSKVVSFRVQ
jgi:hypothetical protein